jgi:superfamily II DNA helicase RecQ
MVVMDEIHLVCHFGHSFRKEFQDLKPALFDKLHSSIPLLFLTATCTSRIKRAFESLIGVQITDDHWPSAKQMVNRKVKINVHYSSKPLPLITRSLKPLIMSTPPLPNKVIVYSNQRTKIMFCAERLEDFYDNDDDLCGRDVVTLVGTLTREEKAHLINVFLDSNETNLNVLCATSGVGNAGIDSPNIRAVYRLDFPPSILDISQECGRAGRRADATPNHYSYNICFNLEGFLHLFKRIHSKENEVLNYDYRKQQEKDLFDVAKLLASTTKCYYITLETYLGNPELPCQIIIQHPTDQCIMPCGVCPNCTNEPLIPTLNKEGVKEVLFNILIDGTTAIRESRKWKLVLKSIRNYTNINTKFFGSRARTVTRGKITKAMFVLIAFGILNITLDGDDIIISAAKCSHSNTDLAFNSDVYWEPIDHY